MSGVGKHRAEVRPRYGRLSVLGASIAVTFIALLGGTGIIPVAGDSEASGTTPTTTASKNAAPTPTAQDPEPTAEPESDDAELAAPDNKTDRQARDQPAPSPPAQEIGDTSLPAQSGTGRRVIFSQSRQRVWLATDDEEVARSYPVSGSIYDNLEPGTFEVYSRSEDAYGIDDSGTMKYFVRFTRGPSGASIGLHDIPEKDGEPLQTFDELGTPLSHGCVRQKREDAIALWDFAPIGTKVVVTA